LLGALHGRLYNPTYDVALVLRHDSGHFTSRLVAGFYVTSPRLCQPLVADKPAGMCYRLVSHFSDPACMYTLTLRGSGLYRHVEIVCRVSEQVVFCRIVSNDTTRHRGSPPLLVVVCLSLAL